MLKFKVKDKVKIYKKNLFFNKINKIMDGTIEKIEEWSELDTSVYIEHDCYKIIVSVNNKKIAIQDKYSKLLFRKYEFKLAK